MCSPKSPWVLQALWGLRACHLFCCLWREMPTLGPISGLSQSSTPHQSGPWAVPKYHEEAHRI